MICGVDEAGKGSVLGPMVVAAVGVQSADVFSDLGVKDSKAAHPFKRTGTAFSLIKKRCRVATVIIPAEEIDAIRREMTMNACVARAHAQVIEETRPRYRVCRCVRCQPATGTPKRSGAIFRYCCELYQSTTQTRRTR